MPLTVDRTQRRHYRDGSKEYFSVAQVCALVDPMRYWLTELDPAEPFQLSDPKRAAALRKARRRGRIVHALCAEILRHRAGQCPFPTLKEEYRQVAKAFNNWCNLVDLRPTAIEEPRVSTERYYPFAGTPDAVGELTWRGKRVTAVVEIKTGYPAYWHRVQVVAYSKLVPEASVMHVVYVDRLSHLRKYDPSDLLPKTKSTTVRSPNARDWAVFVSALNVLTWRASPSHW